MKMKSILLAGTVLPFALGTPAIGLGTAAAQSAIVIAQAEECPEGQECPPAQEEEQQEEAAPEEETPEAEEAPAEEAAPEAQEEQAEPEAEPEPEPEAEPEAESEAPAAQERQVEPESETQAEPEAEAEPEVEAAPAEEPGSAREERQRAREQRREQRQQDQQEEAPEEAPAATTAEEPDSAEEPAAVEETAPEAVEETAPEASDQQPATTQEATPSAEGEELTPRELRRRAREERRQQEGGEAPSEQPTEQEPAAEQRASEPAVPPQPAADAAAETESTVEQQLEAQGQGEEADRVRDLREKLRAEQAEIFGRGERDGDAPDGDRRDGERGEGERGDGQRGDGERDGDRADRGDRDRDDDRWWEERRRGDRDRRGEVVERRGDRVIIRLGDQIFVEPRYDANERFLYRARDVEVEELRGGRTRTIVYRENGSRIVTVTNRFGDTVSRVRVLPNGREIVLFDNRYEGDAPPPLIFEEELPPLVVDIPEEEYIVETREASPPEIYEAFTAPPVEQVERAYTLDEVRRSDRLRDKVRRVDLDTITFEFGSATIGMDQINALDAVGEAITRAIEEDPSAVFLIEGHTDAVGSDTDNLLLSDRRAEAVAVALSEDFEIPPENLVTEGYGEQYLKVETEAPERENRRVTMRNISPLLQAQNQ